MAMQVNVFGKQLGAADLMSAADRLAALNYAAQTGQTFGPVSPPAAPPGHLSNVSRWGRDIGANEFLNNTQAIGSAAVGREEFFGPQTPRNRADLDTRHRQQWESMQQAYIRRPVLGQATEFTPEVAAWVASQEAAGYRPLDHLSEEQIRAAMQTGVISVPGGIQHYTAEESAGGVKSTLPPNRGDLARFFEPSMDPNEIVGQPDSLEPSIIPTGMGGVAERASSNRGGNLGAWTQMKRDKVLDKVRWLRQVRDQVENAVYTASFDTTDITNPKMTQFGRMLEKQFGVGAASNPSVAGIFTAAYYSALNDSRFAKWSKEQEKEFDKYRVENEGRNDPRLWETQSFNNVERHARTPLLETLPQKIGDSIETVGQFKFSDPAIKNFMGDAVRTAFANLGSSVSLMVPDTKYMNAESGNVPLNIALRNQVEGTDIPFIRGGERRTIKFEDLHPVKGITFEKIHGRQTLGEVMGIINALQPGKRKNAVFSKPAEISLEQADPNQASAIKGVSSIRNSMVNILQAMPNKLDSYVTNLISSLIYQNPQWKHIIGNVLKIKEEGVNILLQQYVDIQNNGGIFYNTVVQQNSGRHASYELAGMQNLNGQRIATIPITPEAIGLSKETNPDNYNKAEKYFVAAAMTQLGYNAWGDRLPGNDNLRYSAIVRRFKQLLDPNHELRVFQEKMLKYEKALRTEKFAKAEDFGIIWEDGVKYLTDKDSFQALWSLNEFLKAKADPKMSTFLDPYVTGIDSQQNGLFGIGVLMGDIAATQGGGARTKTFNSPDFRNENGILETEKTYMQTLGWARSIFMNRMAEDEDLMKFVNLYFVNSDPDMELQNLFQKEFAKKVVVGGQYGQMEKASATSMRIGFLEWLERVDNPISEELIRDKIMKDINEWAEVPNNTHYETDKATQSNLDEVRPVIYFKPDQSKRRITNKIGIRGKALEQMQKVAEIFNMAMHRAAPGISDYTSKMKDIYTVMVELAGYSNDNNLDILSGIELPVLEPDVTDPSKPIYDKNGFANDWKVGNRINLLDTAIEDDWIAIPFQDWYVNEQTGGLDENQWQERLIWLKKSSRDYNTDVKREGEALDPNSPIRPKSAGLTRFPVVSLHILDDLAMSITVHELARKYPDEFDWFNSVWDEGKVRKQFRERFANEYNKAWMAVLLENNYFRQMAQAFQDNLNNISADHLATIFARREDGEYLRPRAVQTFELLESKIGDLVNDANDLQSGSHQRGNIDKVIANMQKRFPANMNANTPNYEKNLRLVDGEVIVKGAMDYTQRTTGGQFSKSIANIVDEGLKSGATREEKRKALFELARRKRR